MTHQSMMLCDVLLTWPSDGIRLFESMLPMGIASLAAVLRQNGIRVHIVDFNHYQGDFRVDLLKWNPRVVGIGGTTATRNGSFLTAKLTKAVLPNCHVVYGGPHASFAWEDTLTHCSDIDTILRGESEYSLLALCQHILSGISGIPLDIPGLVWRDETGKIRTNSPQRIQDLSTLPLPARDLFQHDYRMSIDHTDIVADFIMTSRGCPVLCDFCSASRLFPGGVRLRPLDSIEQELRWIREHKPHVQGIKIFDSTFTAVRSHVESVSQLMHQFGFRWECEIRADSVDLELLTFMKNHGCVFVSIGFETTNNELLQKMGKKIQSQQVDQVIEWCKNLGIIAKVFFTFGHLGETYSQCQEDLQFLKANKKRIPFFGVTVGIRIYPGTVLEYRARKQGLIPADFSWYNYKPSWRNYFVMEPGNVLILEQPGLRLPQLGRVLWKALRQGTTLSPAYVFKMVPLNLWMLVQMTIQQMRYTKHRIQREQRKLSVALAWTDCP